MPVIQDERSIDKGTVTLAGIELYGRGDVSWSLAAGVRPVVKRFEVPANQVDEFMEKAGGPVTLRFEPVDETPSEFKNLWILGVEPTDSPFWFNLVVADRRWMWDRKHIRRIYNKRKVIGYQRITRIDTLELQPVEPRFGYWDWSTKDGNGEKWQALDVMLDILGNAFAIEAAFTRIQTPQSVRLFSQGKLNQSSIENLEIDDPADKAVARALSYLPDFALYLDAEGRPVLNHRSALRDREMALKIQPEIYGAGHIAHVARNRQMPGRIIVWFSLECECRFDFIEQPGHAHR